MKDCDKVVVTGLSQTKQRGLFVHERRINLLKIYLQEIKIKILAVLFCQIAYLSVLSSNYDAVLSIESTGSKRI